MRIRYYSVDYSHSQLTINVHDNKPKGGAKETLAKIEKILREQHLSNKEKETLLNISNTIHFGYYQKNRDSFFLRGVTRKVDKLAISINSLTSPELVPDLFSLMAPFLSRQDLAHLTQCSKSQLIHESLEKDWCDRAKALGWPGDGGVEGAKQYHKTLVELFRKLKIVDPDKVAETHIRNLTSVLQERRNKGKVLSREELRVLLCFLNEKLKRSDLKKIGSKEELTSVLWHYVRGYRSDELSLLYLTMHASLGFEPKRLPRVKKIETARKMAALFPAFDFTDALHAVIEEGDKLWVKALLEAKIQVDVNKKVNSIHGQKTALELAVYRHENNAIALLLKDDRLLLPHQNTPGNRKFILELIDDYLEMERAEMIFAAMAKKKMNIGAILNRPRRDIYNFPATWLQRAIEHDHSLNTIQALLELGADIHPTDRYLSALACAREYKRDDVEEFLLTKIDPLHT